MTIQPTAGSLPVRGYTGRPLGRQVRPYEETLSAGQVLRDHFLPHLKPERLTAATPSQTGRFA